MKLIRLLLTYYSKISSFLENKFLSILKILLPGKLYIIFIALLPLIKLLYRYGKNLHSVIGLLFLGVVLDFSLSIRSIIDNFFSVFRISFDMFNKILEKLFNVNISSNYDKFNNKIIEKTNNKIIEKTNNKITEHKSFNEPTKEYESLRKYYKKRY